MTICIKTKLEKFWYSSFCNSRRILANSVTIFGLFDGLNSIWQAFERTYFGKKIIAPIIPDKLNAAEPASKPGSKPSQDDPGSGPKSILKKKRKPAKRKINYDPTQRRPSREIEIYGMGAKSLLLLQARS